MKSITNRLKAYYASKTWLPIFVKKGTINDYVLDDEVFFRQSRSVSDLKDRQEITENVEAGNLLAGRIFDYLKAEYQTQFDLVWQKMIANPLKTLHLWLLPFLLLKQIRKQLNQDIWLYKYHNGESNQWDDWLKIADLDTVVLENGADLEIKGERIDYIEPINKNKHIVAAKKVVIWFGGKGSVIGRHRLRIASTEELKKQLKGNTENFDV